MDRISQSKRIKQIAREYGKSKNARELSIEFGISRQRVHQIVVRLRKLGVNVAKIGRGRDNIYKDIVHELQEESPELFTPLDKL